MIIKTLKMSARTRN
ncbi:TPA: hypothetical protein ACF27D_004684 [Escherichia coli]